jgi:ParB family transcriptional regulator, chromosome partitioning protein
MSHSYRVTKKTARNVLSEATSIYMMNREHHLTLRTIANIHGRSYSWVTQRLSLLRLSPKVREMLMRGEIRYSIAILLTKYPDEVFQVNLAQSISEKTLPYHSAKKLIEQCAVDIDLFPKHARKSREEVIAAWQ